MDDFSQCIPWHSHVPLSQKRGRETGSRYFRLPHTPLRDLSDLFFYSLLFCPFLSWQKIEQVVETNLYLPSCFPVTWNTPCQPLPVFQLSCKTPRWKQGASPPVGVGREILLRFFGTFIYIFYLFLTLLHAPWDIGQNAAYWLHEASEFFSIDILKPKHGVINLPLNVPGGFFLIN